MSTTTTQVSSASLTMAVVIGSLVVFAVVIAILAWVCPQSPPPRTLHQIRDNASAVEPNNDRPVITSPEEGPPKCGFKNIFGRRSLIGSNELVDSLRISPSNPVIFGDGKSAEDSVKVVLTPPTPLRAENGYYNAAFSR